MADSIPRTPSGLDGRRRPTGCKPHISLNSGSGRAVRAFGFGGQFRKAQIEGDGDSADRAPGRIDTSRLEMRQPGRVDVSSFGELTLGQVAV